jgi:hypothetical protein
VQDFDAEFDLTLLSFEPSQFSTQLLRSAHPGQSKGVNSSSHPQEPEFTISLAVETGLSIRFQRMSCVDDIIQPHGVGI